MFLLSRTNFASLYLGKDDRYVDLTENMERKVTVEEITKALTNI